MTRTARCGVLLVVFALLAGQVGAQNGDPNFWALRFENDTPQALVLDDPLGQLSYYWFMVYRVSNPDKRPLPCRLDFTLQLRLEKTQEEFRDVADRVAERYLEQKELQKPLLSTVEIQASPIKPGETREGVAIFRLGRKASDFDHMTIFVRGLAARRELGRPDERPDARKFRDRVLNLKYVYVASRWRTGKELKLDGEEWGLEAVEVTDRPKVQPGEGSEAAQRLKDLQEKAKQLREKLPPEEPKPPPEASRGKGPPDLGQAPTAPVAEPSAPRILKALRTVAGKSKTTRAAFTEVVGRGPSRREAKGTIYLGKDRKFAVERLLEVGQGQSLKELRVFDGTALWAHTTTREVGDTVRRCKVGTARKHWCTLDGKPEVDFATVANPVQAWRLFGDDLVHLGVEWIGDEGAYVFEIRPDARYRPLCTGPLSSEVLYKAVGRRVRFWIGASSGFQLRMRVYDEAANVVASLECSDLELDAHIPRERLAYTPPPGVKVIDLDTAIADSQ